MSTPKPYYLQNHHQWKKLKPTWKDLLHLKTQRRNHSAMGRGADSWYNQVKSHTSRWVTHKLQRFCRNECSEPSVEFLQPGGPAQEDEPPEHLALRPSSPLLQEPPALRKTEGDEGGERKKNRGTHTQRQRKQAIFCHCSKLWIQP